MNTDSRVTMLTFGLALAMLAVATLIVALDLSLRQVEAARQQARAWEIYALSLHRRDLLGSGGGFTQGLPPPYGLVARRLERVELQAQAHGLGFSF